MEIILTDDHRILKIASQGGDMWVVMRMHYRLMAFAHAPLDRCRIVYADLWIGNASFDLSATEVERVKAAYPALRDATPDAVDKHCGIG